MSSEPSSETAIDAPEPAAPLRATRGRRLATAAALVFVVTSSVGAFSWAGKEQLYYMDGMAEEYYVLGWNLYRNGTFSHSDPATDPYERLWLRGSPPVSPVFRPPGYPVFVAGVLSLWNGATSERVRNGDEAWVVSKEGAARVLLAQYVLLALSAVVLFLWVSSHVRTWIAASIAILYGTCSYLLALASVLHYATVHLFLVLLGTWCLQGAIKADRRRTVRLLAAGVVWGLASLTRPTSLVLPGVLLVALLAIRLPLRDSLRSTALVMLGMAAVVAPYTVRNYRLTGRVIPVNAQAKVSVWASTQRNLPIAPNEYRWWPLWWEDGMRIYEAVVGSRKFDCGTYYARLLEIEDAFGREAWTNLTTRPGVYAHNVLANFVTFNLHINSLVVEAFRAVQDPSVVFDQGWLSPSSGRRPPSTSAATGLEAFVGLLELLALGGAAIAVARRDRFWVAAATGYGTFCLAHTITYMDFMYYYVKIPFLFAFAAYLLDVLAHRPPRMRGRPIPAALALSVLLAAGGSALTVAVLAA